MEEQYFIDEKLLQKKKWGTQQRVGFTLMMIGGIGIAISIIAQYISQLERGLLDECIVFVCV